MNSSKPERINNPLNGSTKESSPLSAENRKQVKKDLVIIFFATLIPLIIYLFFETIWNINGRDERINFWLRFWPICLSAYGLGGLGCTIVFIMRKEKFSDYGFVCLNILPAICLSVLSFLPHFLFMLFTGDIQGYLPMNGTVLTDSALARPFPQNIFCMGLLFLIWGFFEGSAYVYIGKKINLLIPPRHKWLNGGALFGAVVCVLIHGMVGLDLLTIIEGVTVFIFIYGILITKEVTGNAWGVIFAFFFLWNAF